MATVAHSWQKMQYLLTHYLVCLCSIWWKPSPSFLYVFQRKLLHTASVLFFIQFAELRMLLRGKSLEMLNEVMCVVCLSRKISCADIACSRGVWWLKLSKIVPEDESFRPLHFLDRTAPMDCMWMNCNWYLRYGNNVFLYSLFISHMLSTCSHCFYCCIQC